MGVYEGPSAGPGELHAYTLGNYADGIRHRFNFPDSFAEAVKDAGFGLVTNANNHLLDQGLAGALRTIDVLDEIGLNHTGSYRTQQEKEQQRAFFIEIKGLKFAFLAYTYNTNKHKAQVRGEWSFITSCLVSPKDESFEKTKAAVFEDFRRVKEANPDIIVVLPHMGSFLTHKLNEYQEAWYRVFSEFGADVIVCDHSHAVHPIDFYEDVLIINGVGNFVNQYIEYNGDASALAEVYFDKELKKPIAVSIVPLYAQAPLGNTYRALPIFDIMTNERLRSQIGVYEFRRVEEVQRIVTKIMLDYEVPTSMAAERYYFTKKGFLHDVIAPCSVENFEDSAIIRFLSESNSVCFVGDSITDGTKNGGIGWFEPLVAHFMDLNVSKKAWGDATINTLIERIDSIVECNADSYVVAIGVNDVRYRNKIKSKICAMTPEQYTTRLGDFVRLIQRRHQSAKFAFVAPWPAFPYDPNNKCGSNRKRDALLIRYATALRKFCAERGFLFLDPNTYLSSVFRMESRSKYLSDHIHPNRLHGVQLYARAVAAAP